MLLRTKRHAGKSRCCLFKLYLDRDTGAAFEDLFKIVGRNYPLLAYLLYTQPALPEVRSMSSNRFRRMKSSGSRAEE